MAGAGADIYNLAPAGDLLRSIECPICGDVPIPPIFNCSNGHFICDSCRKAAKSCGVCRANFTTMRNYPLEAIVRSSTFKCKHEADGCRERILGDAYSNHLLICEFRSVACSHPDTKKCTKAMVPLGSFITHLRDVHKYPNHVYVMHSTGLILTEKGANINGRGDPTLWPLDIITYKDSYIFAHKMISQGIYRVWLAYFGSESDAQGLEATVVLTKPNTQHPSVVWTIPVHPFRKSVVEIHNSALYFAIPVANLETFCNQQAAANVVNYNWQIQYIIAAKK